MSPSARQSRKKRSSSVPWDGWLRFSGDDSVLPEKDRLRRDHYELNTHVYLGKSMENTRHFGECRHFRSQRPAKPAMSPKSRWKPSLIPFSGSAGLRGLCGESKGHRRERRESPRRPQSRKNASEAPAAVAMTGNRFGPRLPFWQRPGKSMESRCKSGGARKSLWKATAVLAMTGKLLSQDLPNRRWLEKELGNWCPFG